MGELEELLERAARLLRREASRVEDGTAKPYDVARVVKLLNEMGEVHCVRIRRVEVEDMPDLMPEGIREAYYRLWETVHGGYRSPAGRLADDAVLGRATGRASRGRVSSSGKEYRGGATRAVVGVGGGLKDERALRFKKKVDKKLRYLKRDIDGFLGEGDGGAVRMKRCGKCGKMGDQDWKFCPRCSAGLVWVE